MLIPFGILSASAVGSDYELIESSILGSNTSTITFSGLATYASIYEHLQIRISYGSNTGANGTYTRMRLNGDSGTNYARHALEGRGATGVFSTANINQNAMFVGPNSGTQNSLHSEAHILDFLDSFSTTKNKTIRSLGGVTSTAHGIILMSHLWMSTSSLTSIEIQAMSQGVTSTYGSGSRFSLYGIKG